MGRSSRGGGGSSRSSSSSRSHSSSSRSHSSSRSYSSSAGRSSRGSGSGSFSRPSGSSYYRPSNSVHVHNHYGGGYGRRYGGGGYGGGVPLAFIVACIIMTLMIIVIVIASAQTAASGTIPASTVNRERLDLGYGYRSDNVIDEIGWIRSPAKLSRDLQYFYDKTGVYPFIVLLGPNEATGSDETEYAYAERVFEKLKSDGRINEGSLLLVYFDTGLDYEDGASQMVLGLQTESVMDQEAVDIFWAYYNKYFFADCDEDEMFRGIFCGTADRIMQRTTTGADVGLQAFKAVLVIVVIIGVCAVITLKRKAERERARETAEILSAPIQGSRADDDPLVQQYGGNDDT